MTRCESPPPKKRLASSRAKIRLKLLVLRYYVAAFLAILFGVPFWRYEQKRTRLLDRIDNERNGK
jgi:hypothetical protein